MAMSTKQLKELEAKLSEKLFLNIELLTRVYPTTKEFDAVFKKDMFTKCNKAAFQQVVYYLFSVLNRELTKQKIVSWPLYEARLESAFRNEIVAFINYINTEYEYADVPHIMSSQLVSPGGLKFSKFMLKLSKLVLYEHLRKNESIERSLLVPVRAHKNSAVSKIVTESLKTRTTFASHKIHEWHEKLEEIHENAVQKAADIVAEQTEVEKELYSVNKRLEEKRQEIDSGAMVVQWEKINDLKKKIQSMDSIKNLCNSGKELLTHLSDKNSTLEYKKEVTIPNSIKHLYQTTGDKLDMYQLFNGLNVLIENMNLEMPSVTTDQLAEMTKLVIELNEKYLHLDNKMAVYKNELLELVESFSRVYYGTDRNDVPKSSITPAQDL